MILKKKKKKEKSFRRCHFR